MKEKWKNVRVMSVLLIFAMVTMMMSGVAFATDRRQLITPTPEESECDMEATVEEMGDDEEVALAEETEAENDYVTEDIIPMGNNVLARMGAGQIFEFRNVSDRTITIHFEGDGNAKVDFYSYTRTGELTTTTFGTGRDIYLSGLYAHGRGRRLPAGAKAVVEHLGGGTFSVLGDENAIRARELLTPVWYTRIMRLGDVEHFEQSGVGWHFLYWRSLYGGGSISWERIQPDGTTTRNRPGFNWTRISGGINLASGDRAILTGVNADVSRPGWYSEVRGTHTAFSGQPYRLTIDGDRSFPPGWEGEAPPPGDDPPGMLSDYHEAAAFIVDGREALYSPLISGIRLHVYRTDYRVLACPEEGFAFGDFPSSSYYLIDKGWAETDIPRLVVDEEILRKAGFLHSVNYPLGRDLSVSAPAHLEQRIGQIQGMESRGRSYRSNYERVVSDYNFAKLQETILKWTGRIAGAILTKGKSLISEALLYNTFGRFVEQESVQVVDYLRGVRSGVEEMFFINTYLLLSHSLVDPNSFCTIYLANCSIAFRMARVEFNYVEFYEKHKLAAQHIVSELNRQQNINNAQSAHMIFGLGFDFMSAINISSAYIDVVAYATKMAGMTTDLRVQADTSNIPGISEIYERIRNAYLQYNKAYCASHMRRFMNNHLRSSIHNTQLVELDQTVIINSPVNVMVYDRAGNLIGRTENNSVIQSAGIISYNPIIVGVGERGTVLNFAHTSNYRIEIIATNYGWMQFLEFRTDENGNVISDTLMKNIILEPGKQFTVNPHGDNNFGTLFSGNAPYPPVDDNGGCSNGPPEEGNGYECDVPCSGERAPLTGDITNAALLLLIGMISLNVLVVVGNTKIVERKDGRRHKNN